MLNPCAGVGDMSPLGVAGEGPGSPLAVGPAGIPFCLQQQEGPGSPHPLTHGFHEPHVMGSPHPMSPAHHGFPLGVPPPLHGFGAGAGAGPWDVPAMLNPDERMGGPGVHGRMLDMAMPHGNTMGPLCQGDFPASMAPPIVGAYAVPSEGAATQRPGAATATGACNVDPAPSNFSSAEATAAASQPAATAPASDFVLELQQLLNEPGGVDGHPLLMALRDLLNGALPCMGEPPVDAVSFLGMLREAAGHLAIPGAAQAFNPGSSTAAGAASGRGAGNPGLKAGSGGGLAGDVGDAGGDGGRRLAQLRLDRVRVSNDGSASSSSCYSPARGSVAGAGRDVFASPRGVPQSPGCGPGLLLTPQEMSTARAALVRLLRSAQSMVQSDGFTLMCCQLAPLCEVYDTMHDMPVVMKRRKCKELGAMRDKVLQDAAFVKVRGGCWRRADKAHNAYWDISKRISKSTDASLLTSSDRLF
jgi:hypothetical protein